MSATIGHVVPAGFSSIPDDAAHPSELQPSHYLAAHVLSGGSDGAVLVRDSAQANGANLTLTPSLTSVTLPTTVDSATGMLWKGPGPQNVATARFLHDFIGGEGYNVFLGLEAGNFTMGPGAIQGQPWLGSHNTGIGHNVLKLNTTGWGNTGVGDRALPANTTGITNTAVGTTALFLNTVGLGNVAIGANAMQKNVGGSHHTAVGFNALFNNISPDGTGDNTAVGSGALFANTTGDTCVAMGSGALQSSTLGQAVTALGYQAGWGDGSQTNFKSLTDQMSVFLGAYSSRDAAVPQATTLSYAVAIGARATVGASNAIVLGGIGSFACAVGIGTPTPASGTGLSVAPVFANGQQIDAFKSTTEVTTVAAAATTDTVIVLPAGAVILAVTVRTTTTIPTATSYSVGDSGNATRFSTANVGVAAGSTDPGTKAGAYYNANPTAIRLTMNGGTPANNSGRVRVTIFWYTVTPATS